MFRGLVRPDSVVFLIAFLDGLSARARAFLLSILPLCSVDSSTERSVEVRWCDADDIISASWIAGSASSGKG